MTPSEMHCLAYEAIRNSPINGKQDASTSFRWRNWPVARPAFLRNCRRNHPALPFINLPHSHYYAMLPCHKPFAIIPMCIYEVLFRPVPHGTIVQRYQSPSLGIPCAVCIVNTDKQRFVRRSHRYTYRIVYVWINHFRYSLLFRPVKMNAKDKTMFYHLLDYVIPYSFDLILVGLF